MHFFVTIKRGNIMDQIFFLISSLMSILMLVIIGLLGKKKTFKSRSILLSGISGGSFGAFFIGFLGGIMSRGHYIFAGWSVILGFCFATAFGILFLWQRHVLQKVASRERESHILQKKIQTDSR